MDVHHHVKFGRSATTHMREEEDMDIRKGPWTAEEDSMLFNYINLHGEGRWNSVARSAGLKRTGKSCRLRWLNYLRPDVRRGNITLQEQLMILEFHSRWGNRWSKIAQHLPGRTDNEIKNYWRTRVQKQAKQLKCDVNSRQFRDAMRNVWIPRLVERIQASSESHSSGQVQPTTTTTTTTTTTPNNQMGVNVNVNTSLARQHQVRAYGSNPINPNLMPDMSDSSEAQLSSVSDLTECGGKYPDDSRNRSGLNQQEMDVQVQAYEYSNGWLGGGDSSFESMLSDENMWYLHQQLFDDQV